MVDHRPPPARDNLRDRHNSETPTFWPGIRSETVGSVRPILCPESEPRQMEEAAEPDSWADRLAEPAAGALL